MEAVIFSIRTNGFLVYVPRYALKGPVFLEQVSCGEHEVLYYDEKLGGPVWTAGGSVAVDGDQSAIHVQVEERRMKRQTYRLFDHITVTIQIKVRHLQGTLNDITHHSLLRHNLLQVIREIP